MEIGTQIGGQCWKFVNMFASIPRIGNTESKFKVERFQQLVTEEVALNHAKSVHWSTTNSKFHPKTAHLTLESRKSQKPLRGTDCLQFQKLWRELVAYKTARIRINWFIVLNTFFNIFITIIRHRFGNFE